MKIKIKMTWFILKPELVSPLLHHSTNWSSQAKLASVHCHPPILTSDWLLAHRLSTTSKIPLRSCQHPLTGLAGSQLLGYIEIVPRPLHRRNKKKTSCCQVYSEDVFRDQRLDTLRHCVSSIIVDAQYQTFPLMLIMHLFRTYHRCSE